MAQRVLLSLLLALLGLLSVPVAAVGSNVTITADPSYATVAPNVTASNATGITGSEATLHGNVTDMGGGTITMRGFEWGIETGNYTSSWNETGSFATGIFDHQIGDLSFCTEVFWRAYATNDYGQGNSTEQSFTTSCYPSAPTNLTITQSGPSSITITWTKGTGANTTIIRASADGYPTGVTGGYQVYSGNGTSVTISGFAFDMTASYFRAWSHNSYGYSPDYAQGSVGNPIGVPAIIFAVGLCGFALWKKDWIRVLLSICIIIWGVFAMPYDIKVAAPLLTVGTVLFVIGITNMIQRYREAT